MSEERRVIPLSTQWLGVAFDIAMRNALDENPSFGAEAKAIAWDARRHFMAQIESSAPITLVKLETYLAEDLSILTHQESKT